MIVEGHDGAPVASCFVYTAHDAAMAFVVLLCASPDLGPKQRMTAARTAFDEATAIAKSHVEKMGGNGFVQVFTHSKAFYGIAKKSGYQPVDPFLACFLPIGDIDRDTII